MADPTSPLDRERLAQALALAESAVGLSEPNPRVGCVIGDASGRVFGRGFTQAAGGAHAEVMALADVRAAGIDPTGATAWVTLEPCAHQGRTPPCCDALVRAGIARVVAACGDPFPRVAGRGFERLRAAGVEVRVADGDAGIASRELNIGFFSRHERGRPWIRLKSAGSLDGRTALPNGCSQWITGPQARADGHAWRRRAGAVLTGIGTVLADDPRLDVREVPTHVQPLRVVLDARARTPASARLLAPPGRALLIVGRGADDQALRASGADVIAIGAAEGRVDLTAVLAELTRRDVNELHVEAGPTLSGALLAGGWVDEWLLYVAPLALGPGAPLAALPELDSLTAVPRWRIVDMATIGADLRLRLRPETPRVCAPLI